MKSTKAPWIRGGDDSSKKNDINLPVLTSVILLTGAVVLLIFLVLRPFIGFH